MSSSNKYRNDMYECNMVRGKEGEVEGRPQVGKRGGYVTSVDA